MKIRRFRKEDAGAVSELLNEFLDYTKKSYSGHVLDIDGFMDSKKQKIIKKFMDWFINQKHKRLLVVEDEHIVGYIFGYVEKIPDKKMTKAGHIGSFFVSNKYRRKGVGKELYNSLVDWFREQKCDHLEIDVHHGNTKTLSMYKRWGFKETLIKLKKKL
jgi:ribosomal protein S18 acetylase RimI-like enzyme